MKGDHDIGRLTVVRKREERDGRREAASEKK